MCARPRAIGAAPDSAARTSARIPLAGARAVRHRQRLSRGERTPPVCPSLPPSCLPLRRCASHDGLSQLLRFDRRPGRWLAVEAAGRTLRQVRLREGLGVCRDSPRAGRRPSWHGTHARSTRRLRVHGATRTSASTCRARLRAQKTWCRQQARWRVRVQAAAAEPGHARAESWPFDWDLEGASVLRVAAAVVLIPLVRAPRAISCPARSDATSRRAGRRADWRAGMAGGAPARPAVGGSRRQARQRPRGLLPSRGPARAPGGRGCGAAHSYADAIRQ
jgi:hypothetical protein